MPKYLWQASYTVDGIKGVLKDGGTARRTAVQKMVEGAGGRLEAFYFAFGSDDVVAIVDLPDARAAAGIALTVSAGGGAAVRTVVLLTPEEVDEAAKTAVEYRPPGA